MAILHQLGLKEQPLPLDFQSVFASEGVRMPSAALPAQYSHDYKEMELLGKGGYGRVFRVYFRLDRQEYAVKKVFMTSRKVGNAVKKDQLAGLMAEVQTLARLHHTNVVRISAFCSEFAYLVHIIC